MGDSSGMVSNGEKRIQPHSGTIATFFISGMLVGYIYHRNFQEGLHLARLMFAYGLISTLSLGISCWFILRLKVPFPWNLVWGLGTVAALLSANAAVVNLCYGSSEALGRLLGLGFGLLALLLLNIRQEKRLRSQSGQRPAARS